MLSFFARLSIQPRLADGAESSPRSIESEPEVIPVDQPVALAADRAPSILPCEREEMERSRRPSSGSLVC